MLVGAIIEKGLSDWQIFQQHDGYTDIYLEGSWHCSEQLTFHKVYVRVVREDSNDIVIPWEPCRDIGENRWQISLQNVPAGGLYRIESCLCPSENQAIEWSIRGDMIHHVGVGDLFVIAGQSNSAGYGKDQVYDPPELGIHILKNNGKWDLASHPLNESTNTIHEETREYANPGHSPYLCFAKMLKRELGYPIGLLQASLGGSSLGQWNPKEDGALYRNMSSIIRSQGNHIKGVLWYQGCSDANEAVCRNYFDRFKQMVDQIRYDLEDMQLPVITVQLNRCTRPPNDEYTDSAWGIVREQQRKAAKEIPNVFIIPASDCSLSDAIHNNSVSNITLGERLARMVLARLYQKNSIYNVPDIIEAKIIELNKIVLSFSNVSGRLYTFEVNHDKLPFTIMDQEGLLKITSYEIIDNNKILIVLNREIGSNCLIHGVYEQCPSFVVLIDTATHLPILSFYGVEVKSV